ncbi:MAG: molybdenum cofactor biosynthesis protein MoaE [Thiotrichales bacterium]
MDNVQICPGPFDPWALLQRFQAEAMSDPARSGANAVFLGTMRDRNEGAPVAAMTLEHYPGMTEQHLRQIIAEANARWTLHECFIAHRVGAIQPGATIMLTAVWSSHRKEAFEACRYLVEELKHRAPFWKRETLDSGDTRWVDSNTPG